MGDRAGERIYVMVPAAEYEAAVARGYYRPPSLDEVGFIHASPREQLTRVANKYYLSKSDVRLLHIDPVLVDAEVRWEPAAGAFYPHIYGPLNLNAVVSVSSVLPDPDGVIRIDPSDL